MTILARRLLRLTAIEVISALTRVTVESPGDWDTAPSRLPSIKLRAVNDRKVAATRTMPEFTTTVTLELLATVEAGTDEEAQDALETLGQRIEAAFFSAQPLVRLCQQFSSVVTDIEITADGKRHVGRALTRVDCEVFEAFDPTEINPADYGPLDELSIHAVASTPGFTGPDGPAEGHVLVTLP